MIKTVFLTILFCFYAHSNTYTQHPSPRSTSDSPTAGRPLIRNYDPTEYGAAFNYWAIAQDQRGVMYFGNWNGILEYDGVSWRLISTPNKSGVRSLAIDANYRIYVGAVGDLGYLAPDAVGDMQFVSLLDHVPPENREFNEVWYSYATSQGVYFRTDKILLRWANQRMQTWKPATSFSGLFVVRDRIYIQQWGLGLLELAEDSLRLARGGARFADARIYLMLPYAEVKILIGTREQGLLLYNGISFQIFQTDPATAAFLRENQLSHGAILPEHTPTRVAFALATSRGGVAIIDQHGQLLRILDKAAGLQDHDVNFIFPDRQGAIWLAQGRRIARVEIVSPLSFYGEPAGIKDFVASILRHRGTLYVATGLGVFYLPTRPRKTNSQLASLPEQAPEFRPVAGISAQCWSLVSAGKVLLAATNDGVYQIDGERAIFVKKSIGDSFFSMFLRRSKQDSNRVYVGLRDGLASLRYDPATLKWIDEGRIRGIHEPIWSIVESEDGKLWLGTEAQGVLRVIFSDGISNKTRWNENLQVERFDFQHGLPKGWVGVNAVRSRTIFTSDKGLFRFDNKTNKFFPDSTYGSMFADGSRDVEVVTEDHQGNVWLGSEEAAEINRALRQPDGSYLPEKGSPLQLAKAAIWTIYPENDPNDNGTGSVIWFGGPDGLVRYDANIPKRETVDYPALIRRVTIPREADDDSIIFAGTGATYPTNEQSEVLRPTPFAPRPSLSYSHNALRFECAAPSFDEESANQFQYFLEGFDRGWSAWSKSPKRDYTNLSEGEYRFRVRAKNVYQHESREAIYAFKILPPWYRTWWAYVFYALIVAAGVLGIRRYDMHRQRQKAENQRRAQELEEARQLQLSMLPQTIPQLPDLELAVYMKPATEVGGDYYDFHLREDGALTVVLGDATGHGLKAGTMVTAMKSLFMTLGHEPDLTEIFQQSNQALKRMNLRQIYMTLLLVRINGPHLSICGAGMPPVLIHRAATQQVEEIDLKGMPLGCVPEFPYEQQELEIAPGDVIILMSDGFAERFNFRGEILGYEQAKKVLAAAAPRSADEIIQRFVQAGEAWADGSLQNDDTTFVVVKVKSK
ncbi:SpoIIE family protein phosphatase [candidate division KSB1 bacterium]|nr:SpoIIE family protein phosphatase [candidate division KSB1 bacterium]